MFRFRVFLRALEPIQAIDLKWKTANQAVYMGCRWSEVQILSLRSMESTS